MQTEIKSWLKKYGEITLREVGIREGQSVFDFGCGKGFYTIPAARIVGRTGGVFALDRDGESLEKLMQRVNALGLKNIVQIKTSGDLEIPLNSGSIDVVLLYDIFWYFPVTDSRMAELLWNAHRILKPKGLLSVYPKHVNTGDLKRIIEKNGFYLKDTYDGLFIHEKRIIRDKALNFNMD